MESIKKKKENNKYISDSEAKRSGRYDHYIFLSLVFIISALYFLFFGSHVFFYQENQALFIYSGDYFHQFAIMSGGLLQYAGNFILQGYYNPLTGSLILSALITLVAILFLKIGKKIYPENPFLMSFMIFPACLLIMFHADFNSLPVYSLGFLLVLVCFLFLVNVKKKLFIFLILTLFPLFYYIAGAFAWILGGMYIIHSLINKRIKYPAYLLVLAFITILVFKKIIFFQPLNELLTSPLPQKSLFRYPVLLYLLYGLFVFYPMLLKGTSLLKVKDSNVRSLSTYMAIFILVLTIFSQSRIYNPEIENLFKLEKLFCRQEWGDVIKFQEKMQMRNVVAQYYYNISLAEKDLLCDRMFSSRQDFGTKSIMVQWDSKTNINQIFRGAYFFYTIGLINEAHRWAFESMVIQGYRPENIRMLIKTELISGHYKIAKKYIDVLKRTMNYRGVAKKYEKMLYDHDLIASDAELGGKLRLLPGKDFLIRLQDQQDNVLLMLESNQGNRKAFEYMIAWFMLEKNVENVCEEIAKMKEMGYKRIPRHVEEAEVYFSATTGQISDLGGLTVSNETITRFSKFQSAASMLNADDKKVNKLFGNTLWYYLEFK